MNLKQSNLSKSIMKATSGALAALSILSNSAFAASSNEPKNQNSKLPYIVAGAATTGLIVASGIVLWCVSKTTDKSKIFVDFKDGLKKSIGGAEDKKSLCEAVNAFEKTFKGKIKEDNTEEFQCKLKEIIEIINNDNINEKDEKSFGLLKVALFEDLVSIANNILEDTGVSETGRVKELASKIEATKNTENESVKSEVDNSKINANGVNERKLNEIELNENETSIETVETVKPVEKEEPAVNKEYEQALNEFNAGIDNTKKDLEERWNKITDEEKMSILKTKSNNLCGIISKYDNSKAELVKGIRKTKELTTFRDMYNWIISIDNYLRNYGEYYGECNPDMKDKVSSSIGKFRELADFLFKNGKASELEKKNNEASESAEKK